jgi:uncharacterized membrane protein YukC
MVLSKWAKLLTAAVLAVFFLTAGTAPMRADDKCRDRVQRLEKQLHEAERKHGEHSKQANAKRRQLEEAREKCGHQKDRDHDHDKH